MGFIWRRGAAAASCTSTCAAIPGRTKIPTCPTADVGKSARGPVLRRPARPRCGARDHATVYTVNQDADQWHVLYAWHRNGLASTRSASTSRRRSPTRRSSRDLDRILRDLVLVAPDGADGHTRRQVLAGAPRRALGAAGIYELVDQLDGARRAARPRPGCRPSSTCWTASVVRDNGVEVIVPPLHHQLVTARCASADRRSCARRSASSRTRSPSSSAASRPTPAGLGVTVAWGLPYFRRYVPAAWRAARPARPPRAARPALLPAIRFPSDPHETCSRRTTSPCCCAATRSTTSPTARRRSSRICDVLEPTSIRKGFAGGGFDGGRACRSRWRWRRASAAPS